MPEAAKANPLGFEKVSVLIKRFSIPAIISMLVNAVYNIVDQIFIGQGIDMLGIAATNIIFPIVTICTAVALMFGVGSASNFNIRMGEGDRHTAAYIAGNAITMLLIMGTIIGALQLAFAQPLLYLLGATEATMVYAMPYTVITAFGVPFLVFATGASHLIRADSSPRYAMFTMLSGAVFNLIFDPVFLYVFDMGIAGIALATTLGQVLSCAISAYYIWKRFSSTELKREHLAPGAKHIKAICMLGMAACFNQLAMALVQFTLNKTLVHYGAQSAYGAEIPLSCVGAISKVSFIFFSFSIGIAQGCQPIFGFNYGAKKFDRVKQTYKLALVSASVTSVTAFLIFQLFPRQIIAIFGDAGPLYIQFSVRYMRIFLAMMFVNGIQPVTSNFFTSIGKAKMGVLISMTRQVIFFMPLILLLPLAFGIDGVLFAGPIADAVAATLSFSLVIREMRILTGMQAAGNSDSSEALLSNGGI